MSFKKKVILLLVLAIFTRFFALTWGDHFFFHPDENNMALSLSQLSPQNLNPNFFAYGQFPLYLGYFSLKVLSIPNTFTASIYILRFYSALFSLLSLYFFYKIYPHLNFVLLLIFTPGLIQLAHFGTTESLLILTFALNLYLAKLILRRPSFKLFFFAALVSGIALATKLSGAIFILPIFLAACLSSPLFLFPYALFTLIFALLFSPYNLLAFPNFLSTMRYETSVATGAIPVFYTAQFHTTWPYLFQLTKVFPYASSWPILLFALLALPFLKIASKKYFSIVAISSLLYFLYFGQLYVKWTRFMSPLFFIPPLLASIFLKKFPKLTLIALLPGLFFFANYFLPDTRIAASRYLVSALPPHATLLSEAGNVINLPLLPNDLNVINYDFYHPDSSTLADALFSSDYILVPSRRVFKNYSLPYYQHLFDGTLGFTEIKKISPLNDFFLNPENAEETWSVFDRPTLRIYQKTQALDLNQYVKLVEN